MGTSFEQSASRPTRRKFLQASAVAAGAMAGAARARSAETDTKKPADAPAAKAPRPDILFLMPDQMRGDCLSILNHPVVRTPTVDGLARRGGLFRRAYTTVASCIPARFGLLTGLFPQTSGVVGFRAKPITTPTMPQVLAAAGYATALVGREMHQIAGPEKLGYQQAIRGSTYVGNDDYAAELRQAAPQVKDIRQWVASIGANYNLWPATPWPLDDALHPTAWVASKARKLLAEAAPDKPLFLTASFYAPHPPLFPPKKYFEAYLGRDLPAPARGDWVDYASIKPPPGADGGHRVLLEGDTLRRAQAGYFGLIEHLDDQIAPLISEFIARSEKAGRSWLIVFSTDHGEMLGDHGYFRKCEPFEGSANIPFLLAGSKELGFAPGMRCDRPVCLEDLLPTLAELAGANCPAVDGVSLVPALRGQKQVIREQLHFEHAPCYSRDQAYHALTDGRHKYVWRPTDGRERLFDLQSDPREEHNLAADPAAAKLLETWRSRMVRRLAPRPEGFSDGKQLIPGRPYKPLMAGVRA
ncbi:MAG: Arylsulfatase [Planctomycetes bacterium ADurb.Bin126]|nr:MAG: Arylsulfatase [Planctomycetes bacterium ADurb.Bin126]HOD80099.1 sulfatase-like hydrolase/transferase [Phycisphaerae bacterium]